MNQWIEVCATDDIEAPACVSLNTYPVKVEAGKVLIDTGA